MPGSQRHGYLWPQREHDEPDEYDDRAASYGFDEAEAVPVEVAAGSVVVFALRNVVQIPADLKFEPILWGDIEILGQAESGAGHDAA